MKDKIPLQIIKTTYEEAFEILTMITDAKADYAEIKNKHLEDKLDPEYEQELLAQLNIRNFNQDYIHTIVFYDDAINIFKNKKDPLFRLLFENRQPKITYFLAIQDPVGLDPSVKSNIDSCWLFGGFSSQKFNYIFHQLNSPYDREELFQKYKELTSNQAIIFDYSSSGVELKLLDT